MECKAFHKFREKLIGKPKQKKKNDLAFLIILFETLLRIHTYKYVTYEHNIYIYIYIYIYNKI